MANKRRDKKHRIWPHEACEYCADDIHKLITPDYRAALDSLLAKAKMEALEEAVRVMRDALTTDMATGAGDYGEAEEYANRMVRPILDLMERK